MLLLGAHDSSDWSDWDDRNIREFFNGCVKITCHQHPYRLTTGSGRGGTRDKSAVLFFCLFTEKELFKSDEWHFDIFIFLATVFPRSHSTTTIYSWLLDLALRGLLSLHIFHLSPFSYPLIPKKRRNLSLYQPTSLNLVKSFLGLALNIISRILQPPVLFPPLFSIFNSAPEWGLCEARHACQREI